MYIKLRVVELSPVFLPDVSILRQKLVRSQVFFCPFLGTEFLLEEIGIEHDSCTEQIGKVWGLTSLLSRQIFFKELFVSL